MQKISTLEAFNAWLTDADRQEAAIQDLDLVSQEAIIQKSFDECVFLGCGLSDEQAGHIVTSGGIVIPDIHCRLFETHRPTLYTPEELFHGFDKDNPNAYKNTFDYKVYAQYKDENKDFVRNIKITLARRIHDHSITCLLYTSPSPRDA